MAMTLARLCASCPGLHLTGDAQTVISTVTVDSRRAGPGALFVAVRGAAADGHAFVADAVAAGCAAVAVDAARLPGLELDPAAGRPVAIVAATGTARLPALLARELHGRPDEQLVVAGITGTNGKTTVAFLLRALLGTLRGPCGLLGTVRYETGLTTRPAPLTTPNGPTLFALLAEMAGVGARAAALELSSHALDQGRAAGLALDVAVLTNLGRDHLDYHADLAAYLAAKTRIVDLLRDSPRTKGPGALVYNAAEPAFGGLTAAGAGLRVVRFDAGGGAADGTAEVRVVRRELSASGTQLTIDCLGERLELVSPLVGRFNVENLAAALAAGVALGLPAAACAAALAGAEQVPGRLERIALPTGAVAVVDYAHTPDALAAAAAAWPRTGRRATAARVRLRWRPRSGQAPADGRGGGARGGRRLDHLRQPAWRGAGRHLQRHPRRFRRRGGAARGGLHGRYRSHRGDRRGAGRGARRRRGPGGR